MSARSVRHTAPAGAAPVLGRRRATTAAVAAGVALLLAAAACSGEGNGVLAPRTPVIVNEGGGGTPGTPAVVDALVGQWFRLVYFNDTTGATGVTTSETTWEFRRDGTAARTVVSRVIATGFSDGVLTNATWSASGTTLSITLLPPGAGAGGTGNGGLPPITGNPPFGTPGDSTQATTVSFSFRIDSTSTAGQRTLFLNAVPFIFVGPPVGTTGTRTTP